jgi:hypothetical protein
MQSNLRCVEGLETRIVVGFEVFFNGRPCLRALYLDLTEAWLPLATLRRKVGGDLSHHLGSRSQSRSSVTLL